jgi:hypothetical protein
MRSNVSVKQVRHLPWYATFDWVNYLQEKASLQAVAGVMH